MSRELRRLIATRDAFLEVVATKLSHRIDALARAKTQTNRSAQIEGLRGFAAELLLIARPTEPIVPRLARIELVAWLAALLSPASMKRWGVEIEVDLARAGAAFVRWDEAHLSTALLELLSNAAKYAGARPIAVRLEIKGRRARVVVENPGSWSGPTGKVDRFVREERGANVAGFGVGVWLARRLARANGGRLAYESDGRVTRAIVSLTLDARPLDAPRFVATLRLVKPLRGRPGAKRSSSRRSARSSAATRSRRRRTTPPRRANGRGRA